MTDDPLVQQILALDAPALILVLALLIVASLPPFFVLFSKRVGGGKKALWVILTGTFSWLAYIPFLLLTKPAKRGDGA